MSEEEVFNVSSLVVLCAPENIESLWNRINAMEGAECHYRDESGKIIVTLESQNIDEEIRRLKRIEELEGVISAQMIYAYHSKELQSLREDIEKQEAIPNVLRDENQKAEDIAYGGDVKELLESALKKDS